MKSIRHITILSGTLFALFPSFLPGQNLVFNPSFEEITPDKSVTLNSPIETAAHWSAPHAGKSLLYTTSNGHIYDPNGASWPFKARTGKNVAGMNVYGESMFGEPLREYIQGTLTRPLTVGKQYVFEFWVHYHCEGANNIGIVFLPEKIKDNSTGLLKFQPVSFQKEVTKYNNDKDTWTVVRDTFVAVKPFKSFIIGNFLPDSLTEIEDNGYNHHFAYIDDIVVLELSNKAQVVISRAETEKWEGNTEVSKVLALAPKGVSSETSLVYFKFDSATLQPEAKSMLDEIAAQWGQNPNAVTIALGGHASSEGSSAYNKRLSQRRNQAVRRYLLSKGIPASNISTTAFGEKKPAANNDTEGNRSKNRRVEIRVNQ
ncbi:MAG: OmpA family protein [Saprospiraceae bacterium]|nr:OmpA family protein [Saprospiraceae bacterium]